MSLEPFLGLPFIPLELGHRSLLEPFLIKNKPALSDYTFTSLFAWNEVYTHSWVFLDPETLLVCLHIEGHKHLLQPIGAFSASSQGNLLEKASKLPYALKIFAVDQQFMHIFDAFCAHFTPTKVLEGTNYVYRATDLAFLAGSRYSKKRNLLAQAESYAWSADRFTAEHRERCCAILQTIGPQNDHPELQKELLALQAVCTHFTELDTDGVAIYMDGALVAFSIFGELNPQTAIVYFEKAQREYKGLYQLINRETAKIILEKGYEWINRETDLGHPGLKQAKMSYHPMDLVDYYSLMFCNG